MGDGKDERQPLLQNENNTAYTEGNSGDFAPGKSRIIDFSSW